jgi:hypothetical protein
MRQSPLAKSLLEPHSRPREPLLAVYQLAAPCLGASETTVFRSVNVALRKATNLGFPGAESERSENALCQR